MINSKCGAPLLDNENDSQDPAFNPNISASDKLLQTWTKLTAHLDTVWQVFRNEYLLSLRERYQKTLKTNRVQSHIVPEIGQVVLLGDKQPRGTWKLCIIHGLNKSRDGEIRSAIVKLADGKLLTRALTQLYPLECSNVGSGGHSREKSSNETQKVEKIEKADRPSRKAKEMAKSKIASYYRIESGSESD